MITHTSDTITAISIFIETEIISPNTDYVIPMFDMNQILENGKYVSVGYFPNSVRPLTTWGSCPVNLYVNASHRAWVLRNLGSVADKYEIQWTIFLKKNKNII